MTREFIPLLVLCALVTYLPRAFPFFLTWMKQLPRPLRKFLSMIPIAALGALLFPGVLLEFSFAPLLGLAGIAAAALTGWFFGGLIIPIGSSIAVVYLLLVLFL